MIRSSRTYHGSATWCGDRLGELVERRDRRDRLAEHRLARDGRGREGAAEVRARCGSPRAARPRERRVARPQPSELDARPPPWLVAPPARARAGPSAPRAAPPRAARGGGRQHARAQRRQRLAGLVVEAPALEPVERLALDVGRRGGRARSSRRTRRAAGLVEQLERGADGLLRRRGQRRGRGPRCAGERLDVAELLDREADHRRGRGAQQRRAGRPRARRARRTDPQRRARAS